MNHVVLIGIIRNLQTRSFETGSAVANLVVETTHVQGKSEVSEFHRVAAWGKMAGLVAEFAEKGDLIEITGKLRSSTKDTNGNRFTEVVADTFQLHAKTSRTSSAATQPEKSN